MTDTAVVEHSQECDMSLLVNAAVKQPIIKEYTCTCMVTELNCQMVKEWLVKELVEPAWNILEDNDDVRQVQEDGHLLLELNEPLPVPVTTDSSQEDLVMPVMKKDGKKKTVMTKKMKKEPKKRGLAAVAEKNHKMTAWVKVSKKVTYVAASADKGVRDLDWIRQEEDV